MDSVKKISKFRKPLLCAVAAMFCISVGCRYINPQDDIEAKLALDIMKNMTIYDITSTNTPVTNLTQLSPWYPYVAHQKLSDFGKYAGFKTSIVEKYNFFWPRLTHPKLYGEVICMSAQPFPDVNRRLHRLYISTTGKRELLGSGSNVLVNAYSYAIIPEDWVQLVFRETKPSLVSLPAILPPPPLPPQFERTLHRRYEEFVWNLSGALGQDSSTPVRIILKVGAIIVISALTFFCVFFIRRSRRVRSELQHRSPRA